MADLKTAKDIVDLIDAYLKEVVIPARTEARVADDEMRALNYYNGQKQAYEHCKRMIERTLVETPV